MRSRKETGRRFLASKICWGRSIQGRQSIEMAWGMLLNRFRCWKVVNEWGGDSWADRVHNCLLACVILHNIWSWWRRKDERRAWRHGLQKERRRSSWTQWEWSPKINEMTKRDTSYTHHIINLSNKINNTCKEDVSGNEDLGSDLIRLENS